MSPRSSSLMESVLNRRRFKIRLFLEAIIVGLVSGSAVVLFRFLLEGASTVLLGIYGFLAENPPLYTLGWAAALIVIGFLVKRMVIAEPMISGSGIPQTKGVLYRQLSFNWARVALYKFAGGILAIGSGLSLGREGPSVQIGAVFGQGVASTLDVSKVEEKILITCGASAGLAAAFNAPLAGVMFSLEELHKHFSPPVLLALMGSSLTADYVTRHFFGIEPIFWFPNLPIMPFELFPVLILLGAFTGLLGALYNRNLLQSLALYERQSIIPPALVIAFPLLLSVPLGFICPEVLSGGNLMIDGLNNGEYTLAVLAGLLLVKYIFTMLSYGSGAPGGIFMPMLILGALIGGVFSDACSLFIPFDQGYRGNLIVFAMAAYFTAIVKAPITGCILITEMTGSFEHLLALITVSMTAYIVSDIAKTEPIYDRLLQRVLSRSDSVLFSGMTRRKAIVEAGVMLGSDLDGKLVKDVSWPEKSLLVSVVRGGGEIIPGGSTMLLAGDYIQLLTSEKKASSVKKTLLEMSGSLK